MVSQNRFLTIVAVEALAIMLGSARHRRKGGLVTVAAATESYGVCDIVVTTSRSETNLKDTPITIAGLGVYALPRASVCHGEADILSMAA